MKFIFILMLLSATKSPNKAAWLSFFIPGGGQVYTENYLKAGLIAGLQGYLIYEIYSVYKLKERESISDTAFEYKMSRNAVMYIGLWAFSIADAYTSAHLYKFSRDTTLSEPQGGVFILPGLKKFTFGLFHKF